MITQIFEADCLSNSSYLLSEDLCEYIEDYGLLKLSNASLSDVVTQRHSYWISLEDLNPSGRWKIE